MFKELIFLETGSSYFSGQIGELFNQWQTAGVFSYMLPFLLIFAVVFGLLSKLNIFGTAQDSKKGKPINAIISIAVALMALQFDFVSSFFAELFPRMGVALSIILLFMVLGGLFVPTNKENNWFLVVLTVVIFIVIGAVILKSLGAVGWLSDVPWLANIWNQYGSIIIFGVIIIAVIIITTMEKKSPDKPKMENIFSKLLGAETK